MRLALFVFILFAVVITPFVLWGDQLDGEARRLVAASGAWAGLAIFLLLASDIFLPVPSSAVAVLAGALLGPVAGALVAGAGMTFGSVVGYGAGRRFGEGWTRSFVGAAEYDRLSALLRRRGVWAVAALRPVPVLAEASVLAAGAFAVPPGATLLAAGAGNMLLCGAYAFFGAQAETTSGFVLIFLATLAVPALLWAAARAFGRSST